jgi:membrane-associated phospholipid phosphatase
MPADAAALPAEGTPWTLRRTSALALGAQFLCVVGAFATFSIAAGDPANACGWCGTNAFDEAVRRVLVADDPRGVAWASHALSIVVAPTLALGGVVLPALTSPRRRHAAQNAAVVVNAFLLTTGLADGVKKLTDRERPGFHHGRGALLEAAHAPLERNLSFFSGDTAWAFLFAAAGNAMARRRGYRSARPVAAVGAVVAVSVALLRVAADMHWATDVMAGALAGTAVGLGLPRLLHPREG